MNQEQLRKELQDFYTQTKSVTYADLTRSTNLTLNLIKEVKSSLESEINNLDINNKSEINSIIRKLEQSERNIEFLVKDLKKQSKLDIDKLSNRLNLEISNLKKSIPEMPEIEEADTSEIEDNIDEISLRVKKLEQDDDYIEIEYFNDAIENINKKIESFKKDIGGGYVGRPFFGKTTIKVLDNGTDVSSSVTELNFTNATSITKSGLSGRRVDIETGGSGSGGSSVPIYPTSGAINSSNTAFVFATEPDVIFANGTPLTLKSATNLYGFSWNSGTSTATLDIAPSTGTVVFAFSPVTSSDRDPGVLTVATGTSITPSTALYRIVHQTNTQSAGTLTINADSDTPADGRALTLRIDSTNIQTFSWNGQYVGGANPLPTATSGSGKVDYYSFIYYATDSKYHFIGSALNLG